MIIQCKEKLFNEICDIMQPYEPIIKEELGTGYINCFDKDWIFIHISLKQDIDLFNFSEIINLIQSTKEPYIVGFNDSCTIWQQKISETEQYIFCRCIDEQYQILWGAASYIEFEKIKDEISHVEFKEFKDET